MSKYRLIKWRLFAEERPALPGEYLVIIEGAEESTCLTYEEDDCSYGWHDDNGNYYSVKWWAVRPEHPEGAQEPIPKPPEKKYKLYLTADEIIQFKESLGFVLNYCDHDIPNSMRNALKPLLVCLENMMVDRR